MDIICAPAVIESNGAEHLAEVVKARFPTDIAKLKDMCGGSFFATELRQCQIMLAPISASWSGPSCL
eukprot:8574367-Pyramimonas_sp.AAC.1